MKNKFIYYIFITAISLLCILFINTCYSKKIMVDPTFGNDTDSGTYNSPYKSLSKAGQVAFGGDTILIKGNHHTQFKDDFIRWNNQNNLPIYIMPYNNVSVILDGQGHNFQYTWEAVLTINSSKYIEIRNLQLINNNKGSGLRVVSDAFESKFINIKNCKTSNTNRQGILIQASNVIVESCDISDACLENINQAFGKGGWPATLCTFVDFTHPTMDYCRNIVFRNNIIHNSWGEGISFVRTEGFEASGNIIYDCFSGYIYMDNSFSGNVFNNFLYSTNDHYNINYDNGYTQPAVGIFWAKEGAGGYADTTVMVHDINIYNNLILRTGPAFGWFDDKFNNTANDSYRDIKIYYNTVFDTRGYQSFYLEDSIVYYRRINPTGCEFKNNILCRGKYNNMYREYFTINTDYKDSTMWKIKDNCFIHNYPTGFIPGFYTSNIQGAPSFLDSVSNSSPNNFRLHSGSICVQNGKPVNVSNDYWNVTRDPISPTIGFYEWKSQDKYLKLTSFIQGFYNPATNGMIPDTVTVLLRNSFTPYAITDSIKGYLDSLGKGIFPTSYASGASNYYIVVRHRNSLETWSKTSQSFNSGYMNYDFSTQVTQAYGNNIVQIDTSPVRFGNYSGDVNQNGVIDLTDIIQIYNDASGFKTGYRSTDTNGDNSISLTDVLICYNNSVGFRSVIRP